MKNVFFSGLFLSALVVLSIGCTKGCIDDNALNYDPEATANNGCIYPETINIISVGIESYPTEDNLGIEWDSAGEPDKFIKIFNNETDDLLYTTAVETFSPVAWQIDPVISLEVSDLQLRIELYDQDEMDDVLMDKATLNVEELTGSTAETTNNLYPESGRLTGINGSAFTLSMEWTE